MDGRGGDDVLYGGPGNDRITGGEGHDRLFGALGDDRIFADDGVRDLVDCGPGRDQVDADGIDILKGCELVRKHRLTLRSLLASTWSHVDGCEKPRGAQKDGSSSEAHARGVATPSPT